MRAEIQPTYEAAHVRCSCGNEFMTRATKPEISIEVCSECHPFYTGKQKLMDSGGRGERFRQRQARAPAAGAAEAAAQGARTAGTR